MKSPKRRECLLFIIENQEDGARLLWIICVMSEGLFSIVILKLLISAFVFYIQTRNGRSVVIRFLKIETLKTF